MDRATADSGVSGSKNNFKNNSNTVCFLLGNFPASGFYVPTFRNLFNFHTCL